MSTIRIRPTHEAAREGNDPSYFQARAPEDQLRANPSRRTPVRFTSEGLSLAGHLYRPPDVTPDTITPGIVMAGPLSSVKEQTVPHYAERLADAGYTVLTFDPRTFGESEGMPRWHQDPNMIIQDITHAVTWMRTRRDVDSEAIGLLGVCMGGGYVVSAAARDKRVKAVASVGGGYDVGGSFQRFMGVEGFAAYCRRVNALVEKQALTGGVQYIPTIAHGLSAEVPVAMMPGDEAYSYYERTAKDDAPTWSYQVTAASLELLFAYNAVVHAPLVAPTPMLIVHGTKDLTLPPELARATYDAAIGPKELVWLETHNHVELYDQRPYVSEACGHLVRWLGAQLGASR
ncbi:alpha/beta hydrolase [Pyxidicoccus parkwayensis]|uniref:Alpha/beta hydrolase n=1 Tax=Pyxidicoccus parkwayensis TaxID=2813578 RepID=A0ABX7NWP0_9BACT|nr:alpha/beta hydrolase [Pyxidicoccus parkwaysis]QSQ22888.1 alpha/beta hydrolase [Pyxidicoccus parkwaysis]